MKKNFFFQMKSLLMLFVLSLFCGSAWAQTTPEMDDWTITPVETTLKGQIIKIYVSTEVKLGDDAWTSTMTSDDSKKTVTFMTNDMTSITTGQLEDNDGEYRISIGSSNAAVLKEYQGQQINIKFQAGAFKASQSAGSTQYYDMPEKVVTYTVPAQVEFSFSANPSLVKINDQQALNGFDLIVTAGTEMPKVSHNYARFYFTNKDESEPDKYLVSFDVNQIPELVAGTTNQWKFTGQLATYNGYLVKYIDIYNAPASDKTTLDKGTYALYIPAGAFCSGLSNSETEGSVDYNILPKAEITITTHGVIRDVAEAADPAYTFYVNAKSNTLDNAVGYDDATFGQNWTISDYTGTVEATLNFWEYASIYGKFKVTLDYSKLDLTKSSYVLTIPAGVFQANNDYNEETKLTFTIEDRAKWTQAQGGSEADYAVTVYEEDGVATIVPTTNNLPLTILDASRLKLYYGSGIDVPATFEVEPGSSALKVTADFSMANAPYYVGFQSYAIKAGNTIFVSNLLETTAFPVARIDVTDVATDISNVKATDNGSVIIYNLSGQRLSEPQRGKINIINGKKFMVK